MMQIRLTLFSLLLTWSLSAQTWTSLSTSGNIPARANASMIYHPTENALYVFGGRTQAGFQHDLWKLDLATNVWSEVATQGTAPVVRHTQNAVFDESQNQMLLFSGQGNGLYNDIWSFDFNTLTWTERSPNVNGPGLPQKRYGTVSVFDPTGQRLVTFGGFGSGGTARQDDTWAFDVNDNTWTELQTAVHPLKRCLHNGTYIPERELMVVYGGQSGGNRKDIWTFDLASNTWTERLPATEPPARHFCSVTAIDQDQLYVFGGNGAGQNNFSGALNDLWMFSLLDDTWTPINPINAAPSERVGHCAVYLPTSSQLIVFGGNAANGNYLNDLWVFEDLTTSLTPEPLVRSIDFDLRSANPLPDHLRFAIQWESAQLVQLSLVDGQGKMMHSFGEQNLGQGEHEFSTSLNALPAGIYFLQIQADGQSRNLTRLVK
ncbi:MAG: kelch repeat-containing protein [Bacteroidota bacterium]